MGVLVYCTSIVRNELIYGFANVLHTSSSFRPRTNILIPFEDHELTGLKVDIALEFSVSGYVWWWSVCEAN